MLISPYGDADQSNIIFAVSLRICPAKCRRPCALLICDLLYSEGKRRGGGRKKALYALYSVQAC